MQKLVTVCLYGGQEAFSETREMVYTEERSKSGYCDKENLTREHLSRYLEDGWVVKSVNTLGGATPGEGRIAWEVVGWLVVLLEKS